jgi:hypothetical protein
VEALFSDLLLSVYFFNVWAVVHTSCERAPCFAALPGAASAKALGFGPPECAFFSFPFRCGLFAWSAMVAPAECVFLHDASQKSSAVYSYKDRKRVSFDVAAKLRTSVRQNFETSRRASVDGRDAPLPLSIGGSRDASGPLSVSFDPTEGQLRCSPER